MGEVIRFIPKSERERARLVREARAIYDSIFPPADPVSERQDKAPVSHTVSGANAYRSDGVLLQIATSRPSPPRTSLRSRCSPAWWARRSSPSG
jgi:hypothetical protein